MCGQWRFQMFVWQVRIDLAKVQTFTTRNLKSYFCKMYSQRLIPKLPNQVSKWFKIFFFFTSLQIHKHYSLFSSLPQIACLAFLSFQYPLLLFKGLKGTEKNNATEVSIDLGAVFLTSLSHFCWTVLMSLIVWASCITYLKQLYVLIVYICVNLTFNKKLLLRLTFPFNLWTWDACISCLVIYRLIMLIKSRLRGNVKSDTAHLWPNHFK